MLAKMILLKSKWKVYRPEQFVQGFALYHDRVKQIFFFNNTEKQCLGIQGHYKTVRTVKEFGVKSLKGGFQRRPELIKQRTQNFRPKGAGGGTSYGLFDKCEGIQQELTEKTLELMNSGTSVSAVTGTFMLDIGCGHGWSLTVPALKGFHVTGVDLDLQALSVVQHKICSGYLPSGSVHVVRTDLANQFCFRKNVFDCALSISFLQWLCVGKHSTESLDRFFSDLSYVLISKGRAGIQFYPRNVNDVTKVILQAQKYFKGVLVSDFPHLDRGRKLFLILLNNK